MDKEINTTKRFNKYCRAKSSEYNVECALYAGHVSDHHVSSNGNRRWKVDEVGE